MKRMKSAYTDPKARIPLLLDSSDYYLKTNYNKSFDYLEQAYLLSLKEENAKYRPIVLQKLGDFYAFYKQHDLAGLNYEKSLNHYTSKQSKNKQNTDFYYALKAGTQYRLAGQAKNSISIYGQYNRGSLSKLQILDLDEAYGDAYFALKNYTKSMEYYRAAESGSKELVLMDRNTSIKLKMAKIYSLNNDGQALGLLQEAKVQSAQKSNSIVAIETETEIANYYQQNKMYEEEIVSRNRIISNLGSSDSLSDNLDIDVRKKKYEEQINIAKSYNNQNRYDSTIVVLENSIDKNKSEVDIDALELQKEATKAISEAYLKSGQEEKALASYEEYIRILDELYAKKELEYNDLNRMSNRLLENQGRIDFLEKNKQIYDGELEIRNQERQLQKEKLSFQWWSIVSLIVVIGLLIFAVFMMYQRTRIQKKHNMMLDLKALRSQMNPHFIFNALNSVNNFIAKNDELNANKYLVRFSKLMRSILDNSDLDYIPLSKEVEVLDLYLQLENMRFPDKFSFKFEVDEQINVNDYEVPPMLIQPHIENAIWHGLRYKETDGILKVNLTQENDCLKITVEDNGIGRKKSQELKTKNQQSTQSRGIKNTQKRMEILSKIYKQEIKLQITDSEDYDSGTKVDIWIPKTISSTNKPKLMT